MFYAIRSITLSRRSANAWRIVGATFPRRDRTTEQILEMARGSEFILNLGDTSFRPGEYTTPIWNHGENIELTRTPAALRKTMGYLLPSPIPLSYPADMWLKGPGAGGTNKIRKVYAYEPSIPSGWDLQTHEEGTEYRVLTVGHRAVQVFRREDTQEEERGYRWVGLSGAPVGVKQLARQAAKIVPGDNLIGWDIMDGEEKPYILEGNSCPGMSEATAVRVVAEIRRQIQEGASCQDQ